MSIENETQNEVAEALPTDFDGHVMRTPDDWCRIKQIQILDADGWRGIDAKDWAEPLTELDFEERAMVCTQRIIPLQESAITGPQYPQPQQPGVVTIGSTSGPWLAGAPITAALPAGEQRADALNLTGDGNAPRLPPVVFWCPLSRQLVDVGHADTCPGFGLHEPVLAVVRAAIRLQVAEEIAVALANAGDERSPCRHHRNEEKSDHDSTRYAAYLDAASLARKIGAKA